MNDKEAIVSLTQSEKIKSGLIWASNCLERLPGPGSTEPRGGEPIAAALVDMVSAEAILAKRLGNDERWEKVLDCIEKARVMILSGVAPEGVYHLTRALQQVTAIGRRALGHLKKKGLL
ncbi:MAG: hypothetical protein PVG78_16150 [Desulfobacterales bacterium]|jgi:hypothetical protein